MTLNLYKQKYPKNLTQDKTRNAHQARPAKLVEERCRNNIETIVR